jgi:hypothetical protein
MSAWALLIDALREAFPLKVQEGLNGNASVIANGRSHA